MRVDVPESRARLAIGLTSRAPRWRRAVVSFVSGLLAVLLVLQSTPALADARTEARCALQEGHGLDRRRQVRRRHRRAPEGLPAPSAPERPLQHRARVRRGRRPRRGRRRTFSKYLEGNPPDKEEARADPQEPRGAHQAAAGGRATRPRRRSRPCRPRPSRPAARRRRRVDAGRRRRPCSRRGPRPTSAQARTEDVFAESIVTASKGTQSPLDAPSSTSIITEQDIRLSGITKIPELLRRLAGVDIMEVTGGQTEVSIRGFNQRLSNKTLVLVDGRSVYVDILGATHLAGALDRRRGHPAHRGRARSRLRALRRRRVQRRHQHHHEEAGRR